MYFYKKRGEGTHEPIGLGSVREIVVVGIVNLLVGSISGTERGIKQMGIKKVLPYPKPVSHPILADLGWTSGSH